MTSIREYGSEDYIWDLASVGLPKITLDIRDLPTGQLAEAQLTRFDANGQPIAGTILIDDDANGTGWFIDPTPWESSEFGMRWCL
ncbi:MAG: hypothetical protein F6K00_05440 [Leptolyngbya sp. SIOISBB]|nr:hypothetical protein [Leptolyngbya sp. SIOISBB]